jgi:hypothetical protein
MSRSLSYRVKLPKHKMAYVDIRLTRSTLRSMSHEQMELRGQGGEGLMQLMLGLSALRLERLG